MIEILNILYLLVVCFVIFSFPLNNIYIKRKLIKYNLSIFEIYSTNILFLLTIFLFSSFFNFDIIYLFLTILIFALLNLFFFDWKIYKKQIVPLLIFFLFLLSYSLEISTYPYLDWDASVNWVFKTLNFKSNYGFENLKNVPGYVGYPHLGTYLWALFWKASFIDYEYTGRFVFIFIYLLSFFKLVDNLKISTISKAILLIVIITISFDSILLYGYQEPIMFSLCIIFLTLVEKINNKKNLYLYFMLLIFCANLILWIKNEGMLILLLLNFFIFFKKQITNKIKIILFSIFLILIFIKKNIFLFYFGQFLFGWQGYEFITISEFFSFEVLQRLPFLFYQIAITIVKYPIYLLFIACILISLIKEKNFLKNLDFILFFLFNISMAMAIFYLTTDLSWKHHAKVGLDRILYQTSGVYLIFILRFFENFIFNNKKN